MMMPFRSILLIPLFALAACGGSSSDDATPASDSTTMGYTTAATTDTSTSADSSSNPAAWRLSERGIGPVHVGMTVAEAAAALSVTAAQADTGECAYVGLAGLPAGVSLMTERGRIVRVDADDSSSVATAAGAKVGWTEQQVLAAYPGARVQPHKYDEGNYVIVLPGAPADTTHRIVFEAVRGVVTRFRGGEFPFVEYVEGCS
jgi:hypothetical protein